jgi:hypothetical protein
MDAIFKVWKAKEYYKTTEEGEVSVAVIDGYITTKGRFITREEATKLVKRLQEK